MVALALLTVLQSPRGKRSSILVTFPWNLIPSLRGPPPTEVGLNVLFAAVAPFCVGVLLGGIVWHPFCCSQTRTKVCFILSLPESDLVLSFLPAKGEEIERRCNLVVRKYLNSKHTQTQKAHAEHLLFFPWHLPSSRRDIQIQAWCLHACMMRRLIVHDCVPSKSSKSSATKNRSKLLLKIFVYAGW